MVTRRAFIGQLSALAGAGFLPTRSILAQIVPVYTFAYRKLPMRPGEGGDVLVIGSQSDGGNVLILPSEAGTIVVDAKFAHTAWDLRRDITTHINGEVDLLINTHHHADHTGGNWIFREQATIVAGILHHVLEVTGSEHRAVLEQKIADKFGPVVLAIARDAVEPKLHRRGAVRSWQSFRMT